MWSLIKKDERAYRKAYPDTAGSPVFPQESRWRPASQRAVTIVSCQTMGQYHLCQPGKIERFPEVFYVNCRVFIPVVVRAAFRTCPFTGVKFKMLAVFHDMTAVTACLRRVFRRHFSKKPAIEITLVGDFGKKHSPRNIGDRFCKLMVFQQVRCPDILCKYIVLAFD